MAQNTDFAFGCTSGSTVFLTGEATVLLCRGEATQSWGLFWDFPLKGDVAS